MVLSKVFADQVVGGFVCGVDEAGRGPWAGPLVVGAVRCADIGLLPACVKDSKKLTSAKRQTAYLQLLDLADTGVISVGIGVVSASVVDSGLSSALTVAANLALDEVRPEPEEFVLLDGTFDYIKRFTVLTKPKLDDLEPSVSAASIIAKVTRDNIMVSLAKQYPEYGFDKHKGYGSAAHMKALGLYGPTVEHRLTWSFWKRFPQWSSEVEKLKNTRKSG